MLKRRRALSVACRGGPVVPMVVDFCCREEVRKKTLSTVLLVLGCQLTLRGRGVEREGTMVLLKWMQKLRDEEDRRNWSVVVALDCR